MKTGTILALALGLATLAIGIQAPTAAMAVDYDCADFATQAEAQEYLLPGDPYRLDGDSDGVACEDNPCPCSHETPAGEGPSDEGTTAAPYRLTKSQAKRVSKRLVRKVVRRSRRLDSSRLRGCKRRAERRFDCHLVARGRIASVRTTCRFEVAVKAPNRHPSGRIASRRCTTRRL